MASRRDRSGGFAHCRKTLSSDNCDFTRRRNRTRFGAEHRGFSSFKRSWFLQRFVRAIRRTRGGGGNENESRKHRGFAENAESICGRNFDGRRFDSATSYWRAGFERWFEFGFDRRFEKTRTVRNGKSEADFCDEWFDNRRRTVCDEGKTSQTLFERREKQTFWSGLVGRRGEI